MGVRVKRPIIWVTVAYIVGILIGLKVKWGFGYFFISLIVLALMLVLAKLKWEGLYLLLLLSLFTLTGIANAHIHSMPHRDLDDFIGQTITIYGQVLEISSDISSDRDAKTSFVIKAHSIEKNDIKYDYQGKVRVTVYYGREGDSSTPIDKHTSLDGKTSIKAGHWIGVRGELEKPQGQRNPKGFDYRAYLARRDIHYTMGVQSRNILSIKPERFPWPKSWLKSTSEYMGQAFDTYVGGRESKLLKAMIIGERWLLPFEMKDQFAATGIAHILAISGLHIGFVILMLSWLTNAFRLSPRAAFLIQGAVLVLYSLIVGGNASVVRATIMAIIFLGGRAVGRKLDPLNSLALAAFIILLFRPLDLLEVGFQLSFGAVAGIILYHEHIKALLSRPFKIISNPLALIISAQLGTWPLMAYYFNTFSPMSYIANLILVPIAGIIVMLGLILPLFSAIFPLLAKVVGWWLSIFCGLLIDGNQWLSGFPWATFRVVSPGILFMAIYYLILLILSSERPNFIRKPWKLSGALALFLLLSIPIRPFFDNDLKVIFVDVGQGDCIYIKTPDRKHILVDGGGRPLGMGDFDVGAQVVVPFLLKNGVNKLELVAMSHVHDDHISGLISVVEDLKVGAFMEFSPREPTERYCELNELMDRKNIPHIQAIGGQSYRIGRDVYMDIIYPIPDPKVLDRLYEGNENNLSLVMRIRYQDTSILLTGDIEEGVESYLSDIDRQGAELLKVAHHGSKTSSTAKWLEAVNPSFAIVQSGKNSFGHPDPSVLQRLEDRGVEVFRNDIGGAIICSYKRGKWWISPMREN